MIFPRYPTYKDRGVEWLGEVPGHWEVVRLKHLLQRRITDGPHTTPEFVSEGVPFLSVDGIQDGELKFDGCRYISEDDHEEYRRKALPQRDDLLMGKAASTGKIARVKVDFEFSIWSPLALIRLNPEASNPSFYEHSLKSPIVQAQIDNLCTANTQKNISMDDIPKLVLTRPPLVEQTQIAAFLDRETAKIDGLVAEQRRLMALLKEKRQAVISHAVTQGLNPHAPLKPSGVEWLGEVPAHWKVAPLKYVVRLRSGGTPSRINAAYWDGDVPWASSKDLKVEVLSDTQDHITQKAVDDGAADLVPAGSLLIVVRGMILIHTFPVVKALVPMAINQDLKALTPSAKLDVDFLAWLLRGASKETLGRIDEAAHGTKVLRLEAWTSITLPIPPATEQLAIVRAICESMRQLDTLTAEAQRAIDLLQERRTALISAAVTGQIDVRSLEAVATY